MPAANLETAAEQCSSTMYTRYIAGTLKTNLTAFNAAISPTFPDDDPKKRTIGDWLILLQDLANTLTNASPPILTSYQDFTNAVFMVFRVCWQVVQLMDKGLIPAPDGVVVLAAFNANLA